MIKRIVWLACVVTLISCDAPTQKDSQGILADTLIQQIVDLQDTRDADSSISFFGHENKIYRKFAVAGFGSIQDTSSIEQLFSVFLKDNDPGVRAAAAFALGQTYDSSAAGLLIDGIKQEESLYVRKLSLEAIGKCISQTELPNFYSIEINDSLEEQGLAAGLYYALIRNVYDDFAIEKAISYLNPDNPVQLRNWGANYLARIRNTDLCPFKDELLLRVAYEKNPEIRSKLAAAMGKCKDADVKDKLIQLFKDVDYRVRVSAVQSMGNFMDEEGVVAVVPMLNDEHHQVSTATSEMLIQNISKLNYEFIENVSTDINDSRARRNIQLIKMRFGDSLKVAEQLIEDYGTSSDKYDKAQILRILGLHLPAFDFVVTQLFSSNKKPIMNAAMASLVRYRRSDNLPVELKMESDRLIQKAIETGDLALVIMGTGLITDKSVDFTPFEGNFDFLKKIPVDKLTNPRAQETITRTIAELDSIEYQEPEEEFHPIDWEYASRLNDVEYATIITSEGEIKIKLFADEAPGSVVNFLKLAEQGYYDGITFHRVVPNFVAQAGCNRGDGWGGPGYSIRSEFTERKYKPGSVGMASAGNDTEGSQFFITHTSTPHLDGRYTIFAEVIEGMEIIEQLKVGSEILDIVRESLQKSE